MRQLTVNAKVDNLDRVLAFIEDALSENGCPMKPQMQILIAAEEIFVNIANYAYGEGEGSAWIGIDIQGRRVVAVFEDAGTPYNPLAKEDPDITADADERQIGGLGIFMVKKTMDSVKYAYEGGKNRLTIRKTWPL